MTRQRTARRRLPKPEALKDPAIKKKLERLKEEDIILWDDKRLKEEIEKIKGQRDRLGGLLTDLRRIERGASSKKKKK